jgi:antitoxin MazE
MAVQLVKKWGNSLAVRLPAAVMEAAQLALDQAVDVRAENGRVIIEPVARSYSLDDLLAGITAQNRHDEYDFGVAQGKEWR